MSSRELKKKQSESVSELHTIDVAKALSGAKDAARKLAQDRRGQGPRKAQAQTFTFRTRTLPIILLCAVCIAVATFVLVSRFAG